MRREILAATAGKALKGALPTLNRLPQSLRSSQLKSNVAAEFQDSSYEEEDSSEGVDKADAPTGEVEENAKEG